jgi:pimeloyl-ACP methyl ester carboxylesterase
MKLLLKGFTNCTINTGEVEIGYSVGPGNGPPLLMLHGVTSRRDTFVRLMESLTPLFRVITMDQRGHGFSGHTPGKYNRDDHARDIKYVIENVCEEAPVVWGHSMGGGNAVTLFGKEPKLFRALMLEDPGITAAAKPGETHVSQTRKQFRAFLEMIDASLSIEEMAPKIQKTAPKQPEYFAAWKAECLHQMDVEILRGVVEGRSRGRGDPAKILAGCTCPVFVAQADPAAGGILTDDYLASVVPKRENFTVKKIIGAGHNINREHPELMLADVLPWLKSI